MKNFYAYLREEFGNGSGGAVVIVFPWLKRFKHFATPNEQKLLRYCPQQT
jgi:hypothetical protein